MSGEDFGVGLKKAEQAVDFILNLLATRLGIDHDRVLMGRYGIPALVRLVVDNGGAITDVQQQNDLLYWYVHQAAWGRYSSATESTLDRDLAALEDNGIEGLITELELARGSLVVRPEDFDTQTMGSRFYPVLYMLTRVNDAKDFCSGLPLSAYLLGRGSSLEVHHIFPKAVLYAAGYTRKQVNAVANFAFLTGDCNRKLGMRAPVDYFAQVATGHAGALDSQWIGDEQRLWEVENYLEFLADRRVRLAAATNVLLNSLRDGHGPVKVLGTSGGVVEESLVDDGLRALSDWCAALGLSRPDTPAEITDPETGEALVYADAAWSEGMQVGRSEKVALVLGRDEETEARLGQLGYRFFTTDKAVRHYVEELLNVDLDGDGVIGEVPEDVPIEGHDAEQVPLHQQAGRKAAATKAARAALIAEQGLSVMEAQAIIPGTQATKASKAISEPVSGPATEAEFHEAMTEVYKRAKREAGYTATYFIQAVSERGGLETAKQLINTPTPSQGFTELWERSRLDLTVEALVLEPRFAHLFTRQDLQAASRRLAEYGYEPGAPAV